MRDEFKPMIHRDEDGKFLDYAWPGGYPVYHLCADGGVLCSKCANDPTNPVHTEPQHNDQWRVIASDINWEDEWLTCDHCNAQIECAYPSEEE